MPSPFKAPRVTPTSAPDAALTKPAPKGTGAGAQLRSVIAALSGANAAGETKPSAEHSAAVAAPLPIPSSSPGPGSGRGGMGPDASPGIGSGEVYADADTGTDGDGDGDAVRGSGLMQP